jgi:D-arabinose 1-dehydrogenase-like Zn-dependent alcohol dehydrogenase
VLVPHGRYLVPYDGLDPSMAATLACSGLTAYSALRKLPKVTEEDTILIIGAGGVGLAGIGLARAITPAKVVAIDLSEAKRDAALAQGAHAAVDSAAADARTKIRELSGDRPPLAAIDFVGSGETLRLALDSIDLGGTVVLVGLFGGEITISTPTIALRQANLRGSYVGSLQELRELVKIMQEREVKSVPVATRPMAEVNAILADLAAGRIVGRTVMTP